MDALVLLLVVGFGLVTGAVAGRYGRNTLGWGLFGAALFIVALPLLLFLGPLAATREADVLKAVDLRGHADFDLLLAHTGLDGATLAGALNGLLASGRIETTSTGFRVAEGARVARPIWEQGPRMLPPLPQRPTGAHPDPAERLRQLSALHSEGLLSNDEYESKRRRLLDEL
jgi:hypothetical protein